MAKDDFRCDVCGEYAPAHAPDCAVRLETKAKDAARKVAVPRKRLGLYGR